MEKTMHLKGVTKKFRPAVAQAKGEGVNAKDLAEFKVMNTNPPYTGDPFPVR
jgi:hypothetical protein